MHSHSYLIDTSVIDSLRCEDLCVCKNMAGHSLESACSITSGICGHAKLSCCDCQHRHPRSTKGLLMGFLFPVHPRF